MTGGLGSSELCGDVIDELPAEEGFGHAAIIGHIVQHVKPYVSKDNRTDSPHHYGMAGNDELQFNEKLIARTHRLRNERGWTAEQMATALGIPAERYRKYEYRTPLPHYLLERFALQVGRDIEYLLLGKTSVARIESVEARRKRA